MPSGKSLLWIALTSLVVVVGYEHYKTGGGLAGRKTLRAA